MLKFMSLILSIIFLNNGAFCMDLRSVPTTANLQIPHSWADLEINRVESDSKITSIDYYKLVDCNTYVKNWIITKPLLVYYTYYLTENKTEIKGTCFRSGQNKLKLPSPKDCLRSSSYHFELLCSKEYLNNLM